MTNSDFEGEIIHFLQNLNIQTDQTLAVAVSGGSDSLSLVIALHKLNYNVLAILVNHNLRKESNKEIQQTTSTLKKYNIKYVVKEWDGKYKKNLEAEARYHRYALLIEACKQYGIKVLCIGHHIDDQAETFLLNLSRGSGLDGLCAMPKTMFRDNIQIVRPMLYLSKQNCMEYLQFLKVVWCEDLSNNDTKYKRNKIRFLLEQIDDRNLITKRISRTIDILQEARECLDDMVKSFLNDKTIITFNQQNHQFTIDREKFISLNRYLQKSILVKCISQISNVDYKISLYKTENILASITSKQPFKRTIEKCFVESDKHKYSKNKIIIALNDNLKKYAMIK